MTDERLSDGTERLQRVCRDAARALSASGVGLSVMTGTGMPGITAASDPATERIEELQFAFGEGPCVDAFTTSRPVLVPDLTAGAMTRWPGYAPAVHEAGVRAVFAFPLQVGAVRLGALDVVRAHPGPLSRNDLGVALAFADVAVTALLDAQDHAPAAAHRPDRPDGLGRFDASIEQQAALFQAQGMVMVQLGITLTEALVRIRAYAYAQDRLLSDVAADIVARRLHFNPDRS